MTEPLISVVIVSYQTRELTLRCLARLRAASPTVPYEVIVVDNASTDGSADAIASSEPSATVLRLPENVGFGGAVNVGAARASGRWLLLMNPDTTPVTDVLAAFLAAAQAQPAARIYTGRTLAEDGSDDGRSCFGLPSLWSLTCFATGLSTLWRRSAWFNPEELPRLPRDRAAYVPAASGCLLLVEKALFEELGGFTPDYFMYSEDIDLCARAAQRGARPLLVPEAQVVHVGGAASTSVNKRVMVLRGKCTYLRLRWPARKAALGRLLLTTGIALRALGATVTGRADYWRDVWRRRAEWRAGWPPAPPVPPAPEGQAGGTVPPSSQTLPDQRLPGASTSK